MLLLFKVRNVIELIRFPCLRSRYHTNAPTNSSDLFPTRVTARTSRVFVSECHFKFKAPAEPGLLIFAQPLGRFMFYIETTRKPSRSCISFASRSRRDISRELASTINTTCMINTRFDSYKESLNCRKRIESLHNLRIQPDPHVLSRDAQCIRNRPFPRRSMANDANTVDAQ